VDTAQLIWLVSSGLEQLQIAWLRHSQQSLGDVASTFPSVLVRSGHLTHARCFLSPGPYSFTPHGTTPGLLLASRV
jgi:hypothetical protein